MQILSQRFFGSWLHWQSVFEWEDVLSRECGIPVVPDVWGGPLLGGVKRKLPILGRLVKTRKPSFQFTMTAHLAGEECLPNILPCIIDFQIRDARGLKRFERLFSRNPLVLISSREAFEFLLSRKVGVNIRHWPLSVSDELRFRPDGKPDRKYDVGISTRVNPVLADFLGRYRQSHPDLRVYDGPRPSGRSDYLRLLRESRVMLYSTPGMDGARSDANGFNQVTPRFLEMIAGGCHVLARYPENPDTAFFEMSSLAPNILDYGQFEAEMDRALSRPVDGTGYAAYLKKHYTSVRAPALVRHIRDSGLS